MSKIEQFCPHCGGAFSLDSNQPLQTYLTCPYCGNRSLMQKTESGIRLRGIIGSRPDVPEDPEPDPLKDSQEKAAWPPALPQARPEPKQDLADLIAQAEQQSPQVRQPEPAQQQDMPEPDPGEADYASLIEKVKKAAENSQLPDFNTYSRQVLDLKPDDWQVYALRARLIEAASGLADKTWANPVWYLYTPKQKAALLRQHFYAFNTALQFCPAGERTVLAEDLGKQIIRQALDHLTERAEIRCRKRLFGRTFKGRYRRSDLEETKEFCDAVSLIDPAVSPLGSELLKQAVRRSAAALPPRLAARLGKF